MENFEDIEEYCDIIKETHPEMECIDLYSTAPEIFFMYMENQGLAAFNGIRYLWYDPNAENPTVMTSYELEKTPEFLEMMARWNEKGFYSKSALSDTDSTKFQNGKAALKIHNIDSYVGQAILHPEYDIHYSNMVKDVAHLPYTQDCMVISNTSKNPERAMALWDLITNDQEVYDAFYYGIEGTSYELNDEGQFKVLDTDNYGTSAMWSARSDALNRQAIGTPDDYKTNIDEFESHIVSGQGNEKFTGFVLDTSSFETQLAACNNVQQQYWWPLELGYTDAESGLADYQSQMEAAGIETMKEAAQKQLDAYVAGLK
jgi:putative aldouronate transport system substrate-binding protein